MVIWPDDIVGSKLASLVNMACSCSLAMLVSSWKQHIFFFKVMTRARDNLLIGGT